jgi:hypothetical protein
MAAVPFSEGELQMIEEACVAIDDLSERERKHRELKYARRNKMRYIDRLLNELEMLNLAEQVEIPGALVVAVDQLLEDSEVESQGRPDTVVTAMDLLYEIQDSLMYNQIEDE